MSNINDLSLHQKDITKIFTEEGYIEICFFKGFIKSELNHLNVLVINKNNEVASNFNQQMNLKDKLSSLLKCEVFVTSKNKMYPYFFNKLNTEKNAVKLTPQTTHKKFSTDLLSHFGKKWCFDIGNVQKIDINFSQTAPKK